MLQAPAALLPRPTSRRRMGRKLGFLLLLAAPVLAVQPVSAQQAASDQKMTTKLSLRETATREVEQDTIEAVLTARSEGSAAGRAQNAVNRLMEALLAKAKATSGVTVSTSGYRVTQDFTNDGRPRAWVAEQDLDLKSSDSTALLGLIGELQGDGVLLARLDYVLSPEVRRSLTDALTEEAVKALRDRAARIAKAMDAHVVGIDTMSVTGPNGNPRPLQRMTTMAAAKVDTAPVAEAGMETVQVAIDATVVLAPN